MRLPKNLILLIERAPLNYIPTVLMEKEQRKIGRRETKRRKQELRSLKMWLVCTPNIIILISNKGNPMHCSIVELHDFFLSLLKVIFFHRLEDVKCERDGENSTRLYQPSPLLVGVVTGRIRTGKRKVGTSSWGRGAIKPNHTITESWLNTASCLA